MRDPCKTIVLQGSLHFREFKILNRRLADSGYEFAQALILAKTPDFSKDSMSLY
jgi:hypothetical protein